VSVDERLQCTQIIWQHALRLIGLGRDTLDHQGVDVDKADLQQVRRQHSELLVLQVVGSDLTAFAVEDKAVGFVQVSMTLRPSWISRPARRFSVPNSSVLLCPW
jgi:hypothetical protein